MDETAKEQEVEQLLQYRRVQIIEKPSAKAFVCVFAREEAANGFHVFSFLLPLDRTEMFLADLGWDHRVGDFTPHVHCAESHRDGEMVREVAYLRDGNETGTQALVRSRGFGNHWPSSVELAEEFRLFHNLYYDVARGEYLCCDESGTKVIVARVSGERVEVLLPYLAEFLRAKQMHLALQWDGAYRCRYALTELGVTPGKKDHRGSDSIWHLVVSDHAPLDQCKCVSRLLGKAIIRSPGSVEWHDPGKDRSANVHFIIGHDDTGAPVEHTCDPDQIRDDSSKALRPIFFSRSVLAKYYAEPQKYSVTDAYLRCGAFWDLQMDNDHRNYVIVFLKYLGYLPAAEQNHWRNYNVFPDGGVSETCYTRCIRGWFADPKMPDLRLKHLYPAVNERWLQKFGWALWREPEPEDRYVLNQVHIALDDNQAEFDLQNGLLAKLLNDFINQPEIKTAVKCPPPNEGSLNWFHQWLVEAGVTDADSRLKPLKLIQELRSKGSAHRKGSEYAKVLQRASLDGQSLVEASRRVFLGAVGFLEWLSNDIVPNQRRAPGSVRIPAGENAQ